MKPVDCFQGEMGSQKQFGQWKMSIGAPFPIRWI